MPVAAAIKFVQGALVGTPGVALLGATATPVVCSNGNDTGVSTWTWTVAASPPTSAIAPGTGGTGATFTFTPDVVGCYLLALQLLGSDESEATDVRAFGIVQPNGLLIPPFSGTSGSLNFSSVTTGWDPIMRAWLLLVEALQANIGGSGITTTGPATPQLPVTMTSVRADSSGGVIAYTLPDVSLVPFDGWGFWLWILPGTPSGGHAVTLSRHGSSESLMDPDTGALQTTTWTSADSGTREGRLLRVEWCAEQVAWLISG